MGLILGRLAALRARGTGNLEEGTLRPNESLEAVWQHIRQGLEALIGRSDEDLANLNENGLTQKLYNELERPSGDRPYYFHKEPMENESDGNSRRVDMMVHARDGGRVVLNGVSCAGAEPFLAIEAKRLPTPGTDREREYVQGEQGGISRFKLGLHASELKHVGMIGYVQRQGFDHWQDTINGWVGELIADSSADLPWDAQDKLRRELTAPRLAWLRSENMRVCDKHRLAMRHVWVLLTVEPSQASKKGKRKSSSGK